MEETIGTKILKEKLPVFTNWRYLLLIYILQFSLFIVILYFLWFITSVLWYAALIGQFAVTFIAIFPLIYLTINSNKIRNKYLRRYDRLAYQHLWYRFLSYNEPISSAGLYFIVLLHTYDFLPSIVSFPSNFMTDSLFPIFISLPAGILFVIIGFLIRRPGGGFDVDVDSYVYLMYPEEGREIKGGLYRFIRHPRYLGRGLIAFGLGIFSNNLLAISVSLLHFLPYYILMKFEDQELIGRFGEKFQRRHYELPALFPRFRDWKNVIRYLFHNNR